MNPNYCLNKLADSRSYVIQKHHQCYQLLHKNISSVV
jgi:hypothetical protein